MTCRRCGMPAQGGICRECEIAEAAERRHGVPADQVEADAWTIVQEGLGDAEAEGQTTLTGDIVPGREEGEA